MLPLMRMGVGGDSQVFIVVQQEISEDSWKLLNKLNEIVNVPWIIRGDFNEIAKVNEKRDDSNRNQN